MIPNTPFLLWQKDRELQALIGQQPSSFIALATHSVHGISLKADAEALEKGCKVKAHVSEQITGRKKDLLEKNFF